MPEPKPKKEGIESAIEFTKFVITMDSVLIAFLTGASFLQKLDRPFEKWTATALLVALATSLGAGLLVQMCAVNMIARGDYNLREPALRIPGMVNVIAFAIGSIGVAGLAVHNLYFS